MRARRECGRKSDYNVCERPSAYSHSRLQKQLVSLTHAYVFASEQASAGRSLLRARLARERNRESEREPSAAALRPTFNIYGCDWSPLHVYFIAPWNLHLWRMAGLLHILHAQKRIENSFDLKMKTHLGRLRDLFLDWVSDLMNNAWGVANAFWRGNAFGDQTLCLT